MKNIHLRHLSCSIFLMVLTLWVFCSCGHQEQQTRYRIGVSQCSDDAWRTKFNEELNRELLFHPSYTLEIRSAGDDNERQAADIDYFIGQQVDLIIVAPNEAAELTPAVSRAYDAGIPVVVADRNVTGDKYTAFVGGDNLAVGHLMADYLRGQLPEGGKVLEILGLTGSTPAVLRHRGMMEQLGADSARYEWVRCSGRWFSDRGQEVAAEMLSQHPDIQFIMAQNDQMAIGASRAVEQMSFDHDIIIMGVDGLTGPGNGIEAIAEGRIDASAVYATAGDMVLQTAVKILEGKPFDHKTNLSTYLIMPDAAPLLNSLSQEVDHQVETIQLLKGRVDYYWEQHNLEQALLYAMLCFVGFVIIFIIILYRQYYIKQRLNESLARQQATLTEQRDQLAQQNTQLTQLSKEVEEATKAKLMFFTNVSHDFRTPLTLISAPIEKLAESKNLDIQQQQYIQLAQKNIQVLLRLVTQILDFRKYESGKLELNLAPLDLKEATQTWCQSFRGLAYKQHIRLTLDIDAEASTEAFQTMGDEAKLERIFFNLMGNAFKFTPENGSIHVELLRQQCEDGEASAGSIVLRIGDSGPGISVEHIQHIFENFYQVDSAHHEGSGIGLALVKNFVELHGGTIEVANQTEGTGTIFTVTIPVSPLTQSLAATEQKRAAISAQQVETELGDTAEVEEITEDDTKPVVVVIDDNPDIRTLLHTLLSPHYHVYTASNGQEGISKAMRIVPDIILSDVMMPGIDGLETCRRLKSEVNTCHIPVVLLTACSLDEQRVQGHQEGADAYISKPFNPDVLLAQLDALCKSHQRVKDFFEQTDTPAALPKENVAKVGIDDKFLSKLRGLIEQNLGDSEFGVEQLGDLIGMSRAQLYRKCKALTNYSPVELIRNTRLKKAQLMLAQGDDTIAQVAYAVGFTAPSYFTKCYKDYFGEMPTDLVKRKG